jgi:4-amino-4-deoxychorismate lyase
MAHKFIESICLVDGGYQNLLLHQERVDKTFNKFFGNFESIKLTSILPKINLEGIYKVRVVYDSESEDVEFIEYKKREIKTIEIVESKPFDYSFKFEDRKKIGKLVKASNANDIIISFNGVIKDSSYSNLAFWDGTDWLTPEKPLLEGVKRAQLLAENKLKKTPIRIADLGAFEKVSLINAMLDLGEIEISIETIIPPKISF